ncbi:hypothetical protein PZ938_07605 [Luteipulveratus sp. YIM 133132]|uniref:hypothetical protein n=1 Tax=Luteipulveratus flavus TaxID=3031728 RepID=UPI0023B18C5D|nr:hypothetical protein [Luteipulveratus sp. YIM 133132]MDE9365467.1 hypothetical protein [Luteipulveratus sp. YIM 133132]
MNPRLVLALGWLLFVLSLELAFITPVGQVNGVALVAVLLLLASAFLIDHGMKAGGR